MVFGNSSHHKAVIMILLLGAVLIFTVFLAAPPDSPFTEYKIESPADAATFLSELGWESDIPNITVQTSLLPEQFDDIFTEYNVLQMEQGCDLKKYAGKQVSIYTVPITNYSDAIETVYATLIVHNGRIIGGDIHSAQLNGFMHTLR